MPDERRTRQPMNLAYTKEWIAWAKEERARLEEERAEAEFEVIEDAKDTADA